MPLPDSPTQQSGGYRRKAEMLGHGRNSRMKYTTYTPYDNRMWPGSAAARLLKNSNRPISSRTIPMTGDIGGGGMSLTVYTHNSTENTADSAWDLDFDWTVDNASSDSIDYRIYFVVTGGSAYQIGPSVFTADADGETDEAGETVSVTTGGPNGNVTAFLRIVDDATSNTIQETDTFALVLPAINITPYFAQYAYAMDAFEQARFVVWFNDQVPATSPSLSYKLTMYWREVGATSWNIETNFTGAGQDITTTNDNVQVTHTREAHVAVVGGGVTVEAFFTLILQGTAPVQNYTVAGRFPVEASPITASALAPLDDETVADVTVPTELEVQVNPSAGTANGYEGLLTEIDMNQLELTFYVDTPANVPVTSQTLIIDGPNWNSDPRSHTFTGLAAATYKISRQLIKRYTDASTDTIQAKIASNHQPTVIASGGGYGTFFDLADYFNTTPATIVENATYTHANVGFDDTNNELEFIDTTSGAGPTWGTAAVDIRPDPNPETWINWIPTWKDDFDMVMDFQVTDSNFPAVGSNDEKMLDIQVTPNDYSQPYHLGCGLYYTGTGNEVKIKPTMMWYDRTDAKGGGVTAYPFFGVISTTYTSNTILGTGDTIFGASATRYTLTWKYRAVDIGGGSYVGTLRHYINGYFQDEWVSSEPAEAYDEIYHHRTTDGLRAFSKYYGAKVYEYSLKRTAPHETQDRITAVPSHTATAISSTAFKVEVTSLTVTISSTQYNVYVRHGGTIYPASTGPHTAAYITSNGVTVDNIPATMDGATATVYEILVRPSTWDSGAGVENYLGEYKKSEVILPSFTSATASIGNQTNLTFDIQLATFVASSNITYTVDLDIKRSGVSKKTVTGISFNNTSPTLPYTLYSPDRVDADVDWWSGVTTDHTFTVDMTIKFGSHTLATYTTAATTATIKPALIWRFKDNSTSLDDRDGHGLTWTVQTGTVSYDSTKLSTTSNAVKLRLYNTSNAVSNVLHSKGLTMDIRFHAKGKYVTTATSNAVWSFNNWSTAQSLSFMSHQFYHPNTTMQCFQDDVVGTPWMLNRNVSTWVKSDFETLHNWTAQVQQETEPDGNTYHKYAMARDGTNYDSGNTYNNTEVNLFYPTVSDNDTAARSDFNIQHVGSHLHSIVIEPIGSIP